MTITQSSTRFVAVAAGIALALSLVLAPGIAPAQAAGLSAAQIQSILSLLSSFGADQATINNVNSALNGQATTGTGSGSTGGACPALSRSLQVGSTGADVKALQVFLNSSATTQVASAGAGSPGSESTYFGPATKAAVIKFQTANGVSAIGIVGPATRAAIAAVCGKGGTGTGTGTGAGNGTTGGSVTVSAASQPVNSLAVAGASRVPFTTFTLTNNSSAAVTINSVTVQRTGLGVDANFSGVVLLDSNGLQVGNAKTFNSNHQANIGDTGFTLNAGSSMTFTVAGNIAAAGTVQSGQVVSLQVVAINTGATVSGSLPITGASQTMNNTLTLGSVSTSTSSVVPPTSTSHTQNIGDTGIRFAGLKFTAGSAEDLKLYSIRWRQIGSGSSVDVGNVVTNANGTSYPTTVDSTGKYYTTIFPGGILIPKGNNVDVYIQGDLVGSNSAGRTIQFTVDRVTDVYFVGQLYGYGVAPSGTSQPWYTGDSFSINAGTATTISKSNATKDAAQNIAVNVNNQPFGGFTTNFLGEPVSVSGLKISIATSSGFTGNGPITSISVVDDNGAVVAGPIDEPTTQTTDSTGNGLTFSDTVTFPVGIHTYHIVGKIPSGVTNNSTLTVHVDPTSWSNPTGQVSGNSISLSGNTAFALNQMTIQGATTTITVSSNPTTQNVVAGTQGFTFANIQIDASQSGEDIRLSSLPISFTGSNTPAAQLSGCQLYDGSTALVTGSHVINTLLTSAANTFSFDNALIVPKGTVKTLSVVCNISSGATNQTFQFGISSTYSYTATGVTSGTSVTPTVVTATGGVMSVSTGSATVAVDSSSPSYSLKTAGSTGVTGTVLKFHATNEALNLTKIGLTLDGVGGAKSAGAAANTGTNGTANDVTEAYVYSGSTLVGTAFFTGTGTTATSTLTGAGVALAKDTDTLLTVKLDVANIGVSSPGGIGDIVKVDPLNFEATGASSGQTIKGPSATNTVNGGDAGFQMFKSYPTFSNAGVSCVSPSCNGSAQVLKKFSITANSAGPVGIYQIAIALATSSVNVRQAKLYVYTDSAYSSPANVANTTAGQFGSTAPLTGALDIANPTISFYGGTPLQIPAGQTYYFSLVGDLTVASGQTTWSVNATVQGNSATTTSLANYNVNTIANMITHTSAIETGSGTTLVGESTTTPNAAGTFIWSGNSTTTAATTDVDWANGYSVPGLPSSGF